MNIKLFSETTNLRRVPLEEQEQLTLLVHLSSLPVFSGVRATQSLVLCVYFVDHCLSFFFSPLCCLSFIDLQILITPLVSCPLCCLSFIDLRILITPLVSWPLCCLSFFDLRIRITPLVSFGHCVVVLLWYTDSDYPFGIFWPLCGCPSLIYGFWLPLWYLQTLLTGADDFTPGFSGVRVAKSLD